MNVPGDNVVTGMISLGGGGSVTANSRSAIDLDLHKKPLHRIGSIWHQNHVELNLYLSYFVHFFHSESILCLFKITAANITWHYVI